MEPVDEYLWVMITMVVSFIISLLVFFNAKRKWLGCILQFFTFIALIIFSGMLFGMCRGFVDSSNESEAMVGVRLIEENRDCRYETKYWMKPDDTYYYEYEKGSNKHKVEPCGNDSYSGDLDNQKVTPVYGNDTLEVISADWDRIKDYFKSH